MTRFFGSGDPLTGLRRCGGLAEEDSVEAMERVVLDGRSRLYRRNREVVLVVSAKCVSRARLEFTGCALFGDCATHCARLRRRCGRRWSVCRLSDGRATHRTPGAQAGLCLTPRSEAVRVEGVVTVRGVRPVGERLVANGAVLCHCVPLCCVRIS